LDFAQNNNPPPTGRRDTSYENHLVALFALTGQHCGESLF